MHGSPLSKIDNRLLWEKFDYQNYGIIGEPYFDVDFDNIFYLTDTGRKWCGEDVSIRDKVSSTYSCKYRSTNDIIDALIDGNFPSRVMITTHPQRWSDKFLPWIWELVAQNTKNIFKKLVVYHANKKNTNTNY